MNALLSINNVVAGYGPVTVLDAVTLDVYGSDRFALLGRNGSGKTTTLKVAMGLADVMSGSVMFDGEDITRLSASARAHRGLGYVPQTRDIFPSLTVEENLIAGLKQRPRTAIEAAYDLFPRLKERRSNGGNQLSGGEQQMLAIARAVVGAPRLLLLDEPLEGLAPIICQELLRALDLMVQEMHIAVLVVEQQVFEILEFAQHAAILDRGTIQYTGPASDLSQRHDILDRHVGVAIP